MNLKLSIHSWILFFICLSSITAEETYSGPLIEWFEALHPNTLCFKALWTIPVANGEPVAWLPNPDRCSGNIKCKKLTNIEELTLPQRPENGVICGSGTEKNPGKMACYNGKCLYVAN